MGGVSYDHEQVWTCSSMLTALHDALPLPLLPKPSIVNADEVIYSSCFKANDPWGIPNITELATRIGECPFH